MQPLLRPNQISQYEDTKATLKQKLGNKHVQDKGAVKSQLTRIEREFDAQRPTEFKSDEVDDAVKRRDHLQAEILQGMPSQEEMRKCPPGSINKHRIHEKKNKDNMSEWKNLQLRLHVGSDDPDVANFEKYRPTKSSLNMDNAAIPGTNYFLPTSEGQSVVFSDDDIKLLRERAPSDVFNALALLPADQRAILKQQYITTWDEPIAEIVKEASAEVGEGLGSSWPTDTSETQEKE